MIDIIGVGDDIQIADSQVPKAANVLSVQLGSLTYEEGFGVDVAYFLDERFSFQNESFKSYLMKRLAESSIDVAGVEESVDTFVSNYSFAIAAPNQNDALVKN